MDMSERERISKRQFENIISAIFCFMNLGFFKIQNVDMFLWKKNREINDFHVPLKHFLTMIVAHCRFTQKFFFPA
jgi:hypothetical protein